MHSDRVRQLLDDLRKELNDKGDETVEQSIEDLDIDINQLLIVAPEVPEKELVEEVIAQARNMEAKFAAKYPVAERLMQEIIYILGRMGV